MRERERERERETQQTGERTDWSQFEEVIFSHGYKLPSFISSNKLENFPLESIQPRQKHDGWIQMDYIVFISDAGVQVFR